MMHASDEGPVVYTAGHSTRTMEALVDLLEAHEIAHMVDVRRFPASRRHPHFSAESLRAALGARGIAYTHVEALGGRRPVQPGSTNTGWRVAGFQGYADYAQTAEFREAFEEVESLARRLSHSGEGHLCVLCAEALPERCHRRLLADLFQARGMRVLHIVDARAARAHSLPDFARVADGWVRWPAKEG